MVSTSEQTTMLAVAEHLFCDLEVRITLTAGGGSRVQGFASTWQRLGLWYRCGRDCKRPGLDVQDEDDKVLQREKGLVLG